MSLLRLQKSHPDSLDEKKLNVHEKFYYTIFVNMLVKYSNTGTKQYLDTARFILYRCLAGTSSILKSQSRAKQPQLC